MTGGAFDFVRGMAIPLRAIRLIFSHRKLRWLAIASSLVTCVTLGALLIGAWPLAHWVAERWASGTPGTVLTVILYLTFLLIGALTIPAVLLSPLQDPISEATEECLFDSQSPPFSLGGLLRSTWVSLRHSLGRLILASAGFLVLLPLNFVFGIGNLAYVVCSAMWASALITVEYLSGPMARHLLPFRHVFKVLRAYFWACFGFGLLMYVILWVPILNFFLVPIAVVGGTLLFHSLKLKSVA